MLKNKRLIVLISLVTVIFFLFSSLTGCDIKHTVITTDSASQTEQTETKQSEDTEPEESTTQAFSSTEELQDNTTTDSENDIMFLNYDINSAFIYPQSGLIITSNPDIRKDFGDMLLSVEISKIEDLEGTLGYDRNTAEKDKKGLEEDNFGEDIDFVFESSKKVVKIGDVNVKDFIVFARFDVCSVVFERKAIFYNNDYQVIITLHGDKDLIMSSMSEYFKIDEQNCDTNLVWNLDKQQDFYDAITSGKAAAPAQTWYNTFNSILEFLQINDFKGASAGYSRLLDKRIYNKNDELSYIISIAYPEFQSAVSSNLSDTINNLILNETVIPTRNDFIKSVQENVTIDNEQMSGQYNLTIDYSIVMCNDYVVSVNLDIYLFVGGAHGTSYFETFNYDIVNNKMLKLEDVFKPGYDYLAFLSDYCAKDISQQIKDGGTEPDEDLIIQGADPSVAENYSQFLITPDSLIIKFLSYQVAPEAAGDFSVKIPYDLIKDNINPESIIPTILH